MGRAFGASLARAGLAVLACVTPVAAGSEPPELVAFEEEMRHETDWADRARADHGPDPFRLLETGIPNRWVGLLRGADALVLLDEGGHELARADAPTSPTGLALTPEGEILVVGEGSPVIARYRLREDSLTPLDRVALPDTYGLRDIAQVGNRLLVLDSTRHRILTLDRTGAALVRVAPCEGPIRVTPIGEYAVASCLLEGSLVVVGREGREVARVVHDGPLWSVHGFERDSRLVLAAGGVENHPLDRSDGTFGHIDSYVFVYEVDPATGSATRRHEINVGALGVVTPKWVELAPRDEGMRLRVAGHASEGLLTLDLSEEGGTPVSDSRTPLPPGTTDIAGVLSANPLLDAWVPLRAPAAAVGTEPRATRSAASRIGEALFSTTLMAPWNDTQGARSRFTCETCHHEGYVDGRTHHTGRGNVFATTKPLVGLHGNRPYFSRALDPTMARMAHNEFRVANKASGRDPWFPLHAEDIGWMGDVDGVPEPMSPLFLRRALMTFLVELEHVPNPATRGRSGFSPQERRGAEIFRDRCESCHAARLVSDDPESAVPFDGWEENLFGPGTIVWGRIGYEKTGITPYVHEKGARVPSLRRLHKKRPYFTNGSAPDLDVVLERITTEDGELQHRQRATPTPLPRADRDALRAFLDLL